MKSLMILAQALSVIAPASAVAQSQTHAAPPSPNPMSIAVNCGLGTSPTGAAAPNLHGNWDFLMDVGGEPSFGLMSIGFVGDAYGGSMTPVRTAPVVLRRVILTGNSLQMVVASREGDVLFNGTLSVRGDRMCGTVTYHGGAMFTMIAQKRPSTYQSPPQSERVSAAPVSGGK